eukprot:GSChrysophyteH1.ASY1.ANO1.213.1 assembled CDS
MNYCNACGADVALSIVAEKSNKSWFCNDCTLENLPNASHCDACSKQRLPTRSQKSPSRPLGTIISEVGGKQWKASGRKQAVEAVGDDHDGGDGGSGNPLGYGRSALKREDSELGGEDSEDDILDQLAGQRTPAKHARKSVCVPFRPPYSSSDKFSNQSSHSHSHSLSLSLSHSGSGSSSSSSSRSSSGSGSGSSSRSEDRAGIAKGGATTSSWSAVNTHSRVSLDDRLAQQGYDDIESESDVDDDDPFAVPFEERQRKEETPTPSFPELSQTFWTVVDLQRKSRCAIDFDDYILDGQDAAAQAKLAEKRRQKNEAKSAKKASGGAAAGTKRKKGGGGFVRHHWKKKKA